MCTLHTSTSVGLTLHPIGGLVAPYPILMLCEFVPLPSLCSFDFMIVVVAFRIMFVSSMGVS